MDGPWTQYAVPAAPPPGPWTKYAASSDAALPMTVQQMYGGTGTQPQPLAGAVTNAVGQGLVQGVGSAIAGTGRAITAAGARGTEGQLAAMDAVDAGKDVPADQDVIGYGSMSPEQRAKMRADFTAAEHGLANREPNAITRAGMAVEGAAPGMFPVAPENEGHLTNIGRMVGGFAPMAAASTFGGPAGMLASAAAVAGQAYDGTYQEAIARGATHDEADAAAGKSAVTQMAAMSLPIGRVMQLVPTSLREGFAKTLVNLGQNGVDIAGKGVELAGRGAELGAGNSLATLAQNYVASQTYDPGRPLTPGTGDAALDGFLAGLVIHSPGAVVGGRTVAPADAADAVMKAPDVDSAINAATQAVGTPGAATEAKTTANTGWGDLFATGPAGDAAGQPTTLTTTGGMKVPYRFNVAEAADLTPASGDLQPRDRAGRVASSGQVFNMANNLDPELLHASPGPDQGAPTVSPDGTILAGNGRTAAIRQAYAMGNAAPYRAMVERYGFDTSGMSEPVLIRRIDQDMTPDEQRQFAVDSNVAAGQRMSGTEQAAIDARNLTPDLLAQYDPQLTGGPTAAGNRNFVRSWVSTLPQSERNGVMGADGTLSADGVRRLSGAMLSLAYDDKGVLSRSLESLDDNTRALTGALTDAAPAWAQLQAEIAAGRVPADMNVAPQLTRAVELVRQARERGQSANDVLAQSDAFNPIDPVTAGFVRAFFNPLMTRAASRSAVADVLRQYAVEAAKTSTDAGLFGDALPPAAPADILATVVNSARSNAPQGADAQLAPVTSVQAVAPPSLVAGVRPAVSTAIPQSVGAASSSRDTTAPSAFGRSAREIKGKQADMEMADLMRTPQPGDARDIIPGAAQTKAEIELTPTASREAKGLRQEFREGFDEREKANNELYHRWIDDVTPSFEQIGTMKDVREAKWKADERAVWGSDPNGAPVSTAPIVDYFNGILSDPIEKSNSYLRKAFQQFIDATTDKAGDPVVLGAKELYGLRQEMARKVKDMATDPDLAHVRDQFGTLLKLTDSIIMSGAPAYRAMLDNYRQASILINAGERLAQGALKITNGSDRIITFGKFDAFMKNLWLERHGPNPYAPAKDIDPATWDHLMQLHERLARSASDQELARTRGSDTTQLMMEMARKGAIGAAHAVVGKLTGGLGNVAIPFVTKQIEQGRQAKRVQQHLNPDLSKYPNPGP